MKYALVIIVVAILVGGASYTYVKVGEQKNHERELAVRKATSAQKKAAAIFPPAKRNEYRSGMLIKLSDMESDSFEVTQAYKWLYKNGVNYGFINRYTDDKKDITGMNGDLTVYRFVGTENARKMRSFGMCLEEYYDYCQAR